MDLAPERIEAGIVDELGYGLVVVDADGTVGARNRPADERLGDRCQPGTPWALQSDGAEEALSLEPGQSMAIRLDGRPLAVSCHAGEAGTIWLLRPRDVEEDLARRLQAEIDARSVAEAAGRAQAAFLGVTSHELRTPLTAVIGFCELLMLDHPAESEVGEGLRRIHESSQQLRQLIERLADYARIEAGNLTLAHEEVDPVSLLDARIPVWQKRAEAKGLAFDCSAGRGAGKALHTDPRRLLQIVDQLVDNALAFTRRGQVSVHLSDRAQSLVIAVRDSGPGVPQHQHDTLFEPIRRIGGSQVSHGFGLHVARRLARLMGGDLELVASGAGGSEFALRLPRVRE
ncbi:MAG: sensor histidine kinase [Planctomycetota bacterium]